MEDDDSSTGSALLRPVRPQVQPNRTAAVIASLLGRAAGRPRRPSTLVRETAAQQLEERRSDWAYSRPVVALDIGWNVAFAATSAAVLVAAVGERPVTPLRLWIVGYAVQCVIHVSLVWVEYRRRQRRRAGAGGGRGGAEDGVGRERATSSDFDAVDSEDDDGGNRSGRTRHCESLNTVASFIWWIIGFYWVVSDGESLLQNAPTLYWLAVIFLAFDVVFAIFCVFLACLIGVALCCCLPCIIAILYAVAGQEGASDADISILPRYRYYEYSEDGQKTTDKGLMIPISENRAMPTTERVLLHEDAACCICLVPYEEGTELHTLPCNHHFHSTCIVRWLRINATCPLCKYNILKGIDTI